MLPLVFVVFLYTNLSMVHTGFEAIPATYLNENVTKYNVRRIDLAIDPENDDLKVNISITHIGQEKPIPCLELVSIGRIHIFIYYSVIVSSKTKLIINIHSHYRKVVK